MQFEYDGSHFETVGYRVPKLVNSVLQNPQNGVSWKVGQYYRRLGTSVFRV